MWYNIGTVKQKEIDNMCDKYLFIPYNFDPCAVDSENPQLMIVDEMQKSVIEKMIDCRAYTDGCFVDLNEVTDLTRENEY